MASDRGHAPGTSSRGMTFSLNLHKVIELLLGGFLQHEQPSIGLVGKLK